MNIPILEFDATIDADGGFETLTVSNAERQLSVNLPPGSDKTTLEISAQSFPLLIAPDLLLENFSAKGTVSATELALTEFEGKAFDGIAKGSARLQWRGGWSLDGKIAVRQMEVAKIAGPIFASGKLEGSGTYSMKASASEKLFSGARLEAEFAVEKGAITNVDLSRVVQGGAAGGGTTTFSEMTGNVTADGGRVQVRQLKMAAGLLSGSGNAELDPQKNLTGRLQAELKSQATMARVGLTISDTLSNPQFRRTN